MADAKLSDSSRQTILSGLKLVILGTIASAAFASRLFAVIRFESIIHELCVAPSPLFRATPATLPCGYIGSSCDRAAAQ